MKKILFSVLLVIASFSTVFAVETGLDGKIGTSYATDPEKFGLNVAADYYVVPDPYLAVGLDFGLYWVKWDRKLGEKEIGPATADVKADSNAYTIPVLGAVQIRLPHLQDSYNIIPYLNVGLGMSFMILNYSQPRYNDGSGDIEAKSETDLYKGFTWQVLGGIAYKPGDNSKIHFLVEMGYRSMKVKRKSIELDMSGFIGMVGVRYPFSS